MRNLKGKKFIAMLSVLMMLTIIFCSGSVFAHPGHPPRGKLLRIEASTSYLVIGEGQTAKVPILAMYENGIKVIEPEECVYEIDHEEIVSVVNGEIIAKQKGVSTVNIFAMGSQTQITVEVKDRWIQ